MSTFAQRTSTNVIHGTPAAVANDVVERVGATLAARHPDGDPSTLRVRPVDPSDPVGSVNGDLTLAIEYNGVTYALTVTIPDPADDPKKYSFDLSRQPGEDEPETIVSFTYSTGTDGSEWNLTITAPQMKFGAVTVKTFTVHLNGSTSPDAVGVGDVRVA